MKGVATLEPKNISLSSLYQERDVVRPHGSVEGGNMQVDGESAVVVDALLNTNLPTHGPRSFSHFAASKMKKSLTTFTGKPASDLSPEEETLDDNIHTRPASTSVSMQSAPQRFLDDGNDNQLHSPFHQKGQKTSKNPFAAFKNVPWLSPEYTPSSIVDTEDGYRSFPTFNVDNRAYTTNIDSKNTNNTKIQDSYNDDSTTTTKNPFAAFKNVPWLSPEYTPPSIVDTEDGYRPFPGLQPVSTFNLDNRAYTTNINNKNTNNTKIQDSYNDDSTTTKKSSK